MQVSAIPDLSNCTAVLRARQRHDFKFRAVLHELQ
jgi:hypothetical protein